MLYDDKETQRSENRFQELLANTRKSLESGALDIIKEQSLVLMDAYDKLMLVEDPTEEDVAYIQQIKDALDEVLQTMKDMQLILGANLVRQAENYYHHIKKAAEDGNEKAKEIYAKLKPQYDEMIRKKLDQASN
jgi:uncharacterized protein YicC (UPF0701 family)